MKKTVLALLAAVLLFGPCVCANAVGGFIQNESFEEGITGFGIARSSSDYAMPAVFHSEYIARSGSASLELLFGGAVGEEQTGSLSSLGFAYQGLMCGSGYNVEQGRSYRSEAWLYTEEQGVRARILVMDGARAAAVSEEFVLEPYSWNRIYYLWDCVKSSAQNSLRIAFYNVSENTSVYIDDVTYIPDYVDNGGFETGTQNWNCGTDAETDTETPINGSASLKLTVEAGGQSGISQSVPVGRFAAQGRYIATAEIYTEVEGVYAMISGGAAASSPAEFELEKGVRNYMELVIDPQQCTDGSLPLSLEFQNVGQEAAVLYIDNVKICDENSIVSAVYREDGSISLSGRLRGGNENACINARITDYASGALLAEGEIRADGQGAYNAALEIGEAQQAKTELLIELSGILGYEEYGNKLYARCSYINKELVAEYVKAIAEAETSGELEAVLENEAAVKGLELDKIEIFRNNTDKQGLYDFLLAAEFAEDYDSVRTAVLQGCAVCTVNNSPAALNSVIGAYAELLGISDMRVYNEYYKSFDAELLDKLAVIWSEEEGGAASINELQQGFLQAVLKTVIREQTLYTNVIGILQAYASELGIDFTRYDTLSDKYDVAVAFAEYAAQTKDLSTLNARLAQLISGQGSAPSSPSGGGNSSGLGNRPFVALPPAEIQQEQERYEFADLQESAWAKEYIEFLLDRGIIAEAEDNRFRPNDYITREEFAKMAALVFGITPEQEGCTFTDVPEGAWYYSYVCAMQKNGIIEGYEDGSFGTGRSITREEVCAVIYRAALLYGVLDKAEVHGPAFADDAEISAYAAEAVRAMSSAGILSGYTDNNFKPAARITRAESAKIVAEVLKLKEAENE